MHVDDGGDDPGVIRRARKRRRMVLFGAVPMLVVMFAAVIAPVVFAVLRDRRAAEDRRREQVELEALYALPYPQSPVQPSDSRIVRQAHLGGINVCTPFMQLESVPGGLVLQARTRETLEVRYQSSPTVMLILAGTGPATVPQGSYRTSPLVLKTDRGELQVHSTEFEAAELAKFKEPDQNSVMHFTVPTAVFLDWIRSTRPSGGIGGITFSVSNADHLVLVDFASTLRPVASSTGSPK